MEQLSLLDLAVQIHQEHKNYRISDAASSPTVRDKLGEGGAKTKAQNNIRAISLLKTLTGQATPEEQAILAQFLGWGLAAPLFAEPLAKEWQKLGTQVREILTPKEYEAARHSIINAYYTSVPVITAIWRGLQHLGFHNGKILEPSCGSGLWLGLGPVDADWTAVELDPISGAIAKQLYPQATIYVSPYEETALPDNYFDLAIGNVPFSEVVPNDPRYLDFGCAGLHDYFFIKSLDKVRPGGLISFITSVGTLQSSKSLEFRQYLSEQANLVGAFRLPQTAFLKFTGTEVTTDVVILQKLAEGIEPVENRWIGLADSGIEIDGKMLKIPQYYADHPEMVLGKLTRDKLYGSPRLAVADDGRNLIQAIADAFGQMPKVYQPFVEETTAKTKRRKEAILIPPSMGRLKPFSYHVHEHEVWQAINGRLELVKGVEGMQRLRMIHMISLRDAVRSVLDAQLNDCDDQYLNQLQTRLNRTFDYFTSRYGWIHSVANRRAFSDDPDFPLLLALENYDPDHPDQTSKTEIFFKRTVQAHVERVSAGSAEEAMIYSLAEKGKLDFIYMEWLTGYSKEELAAELEASNLIYFDPALKGYVTTDAYLSGNVRQKLAEAEKSGLKRNIEALTAIQPKDVTAGEIYVRLGSPWIPESDYRDFIAHLLRCKPQEVTITHSHASAEWEVWLPSEIERSKQNTEIMGSGRVDADRLIELALNLRRPVVHDRIDKDTTVKNVAETRKAQNKQEAIKTEFLNWIWSDLDRADRLVKYYNEHFNCIVPREFNGDHLQFPGMNPDWKAKARQHQRDGAWRVVASGNTGLFICVGGGKSFIMIAASQELRRLGLAIKPCLVVMDHMVEQVAADAIQIYPGIKLIAANTRNMGPDRRKEMAARIATGNWDLVIMSHTAFSKLPLSDQTIAQIKREQCNQYEEDRIRLNDGKRKGRLLKNLEKAKDRIADKIEDVAEKNKDNVVYLEDLGIDYLFADESQAFKNMDLDTKSDRVLGVPGDYSDRAKDFYMKTRYMAHKKGEGKGVVLLTGTPISNTVCEAWVNQLYLQYGELKKQGLLHFDAWLSTYGEIQANVEITPQGTLEIKERLSHFHNLPEWKQMWWQVAMIRTEDDLKLEAPEKELITAEVPATPCQLKFFKWVADRAEQIKNKEVDKKTDNFCRVTTHIRMGVVDLRLLGWSNLKEFLTDDEIAGLGDEYTKVRQCIDNVFQIWDETTPDRLTQLVFSDVGTPGDGWNLYDFIKEELIKKGIPANEIAFIHDAKSDEAKANLFRQVRLGKIRVLIGSTHKMGVGTNVQTRIIAGHGLDCPWRPSDLIQRWGRVARQGCINLSVKLISYVTQGKPYQEKGKTVAGLSPDGYLYQTVETKAKFIGAAMSRNSTMRTIENDSDMTLNYAEIKATATGDPRIMRKVELDAQVSKLHQQNQDWHQQQLQIQRSLREMPGRLARVKKFISEANEDICQLKEGFHLVLKGQKFWDEKEASVALFDLLNNLPAGEEVIGSFNGLPLYSRVDLLGDRYFRLQGNLDYEVKFRDTPRKVYNDLVNLPGMVHEQAEGLQQQLNRLEKEEGDLKAEMKTESPYAAALREAMLSVNALNSELGIKGEDKEERLAA